MENLEVRQEISVLYKILSQFKSQLSGLENPDLIFACEKVPEVKAWTDEIYNQIRDLQIKMLNHADEKYPIQIYQLPLLTQPK